MAEYEVLKGVALQDVSTGIIYPSKDSTIKNVETGKIIIYGGGGINPPIMSPEQQRRYEDLRFQQKQQAEQRIKNEAQERSRRAAEELRQKQINLAEYQRREQENYSLYEQERLRAGIISAYYGEKKVPTGGTSKYGGGYYTTEKVKVTAKDIEPKQIQVYSKAETFVAPDKKVIPIVTYYYKDKSGKEIKYKPTEQELRTGVLTAKGYAPETYERYKPLIKGKEIVGKTYTKTKEKFKVPYSSAKEVLADIDKRIGAIEGAKAGYGFVKYIVDEPIKVAIIRPLKSLGITPETLGEQAAKSLPVPKYFFKQVDKEILQFGIKSASTAIYKDIYKSPFESLAVPYMAGQAVGMGFGLSKELIAQDLIPYKEALQWGKVISKIPQKVSPAIFKYGEALVVKEATKKQLAGVSFKTLMYGTIGTGLTIQALSAETPEEAIGRTAISLKDLYLIGKGFGEGEKYISEPRTKTIVPKRVEMGFEEKQILSRTADDKIIQRSVYEITGKSYAPEIEITTRGQRALSKLFSGIEPKYVGKAGADIPFKVKTPFISKYGEDFTVIEVTPRAKYISTIAGTGEVIDYGKLMKSYPKKLSPIQKRLVEELAGVGKVGKLDIKQKFVPKLLSKKDLYQFGEVLETKYYKGARKGILDFDELIKGRISPGKRITRTTYVSSLKEIPTKETFPFEKFESKMRFKDITKPLSRASGQVYKMEGRILRLKEPIQEGLKVNLNKYDFKLIDLKANLGKQIAKQKIQLQTLPKVIPKIPKTSYSSRVRTILKSEPSFKLLPITKKETRQVPRLETRDVYLKKMGNIIRESEVQKTQPIYKTVQRPKSELLGRTMMKEVFKEKQQGKEMLRGMEKMKMNEKLIQRMASKQVLKEKLKEKFKEKQIVKMPTYTPEIKITIRPKPPIIPKIDLPDRRGLGLGRGYDVFVIKKGKPQVIAKGLYKEAALDIGTKAVLKDLKATFGIKKSDISARDIGTGREFARFRQLFREPTAKSRYRKLGQVYVQRQRKVPGGTGRLTFKGEKRDIQIAKAARMIK